MAYYIISDIKLNDFLVANSMDMDIDDYNSFIINKWNEKITKDDTVFVFGVFAIGKIAELKLLIPKFNGNIYILSYKKENSIFSREQWKRLGIHSVWDCNLIYPITEGNIFIPSQKHTNENKYEYKIVTEKDNQDTVFNNKNLSIEAKYWDYTPILMADLETIIHNMELFESMEDYNKEV